MKSARPCTPIAPLHACSMLIRWTLCHRSLCGRIWESKNISHIDVESSSRACDRRRGWARTRKAVARSCGRSVSRPCSARVVVRRASRLCMHFVVAHARVVAWAWVDFMTILLYFRMHGVFGLIIHARHSNFPETQPPKNRSISRVSARRSCGAHWSRCRLVGSDRGPGEPSPTVWYRDSYPRRNIARAGSADTRI
jgi:hypothetical protein